MTPKITDMNINFNLVVLFMLKNLQIVVLGLFLLTSLSYASSGSAYVYASAVTGLGSGNLTIISVNITSGNGNVMILGPTSVSNDTLTSAQQAASDASAYLNLDKNNYNFTYHIDYTSVSGPSGGLALTLIAISALSNQPLLHNFAVTGTVAQGGDVGQIGGIYEKSLAAVQGGKKFMIVPYAGNGTFEKTLYYIVQQKLGITVVMAANVSQALPYALGTKVPIPLTYNITQNYPLLQIPPLNISCEACNTSQFAQLTSSTLNVTRMQVGKISGNYSVLKNSLINSLDNFAGIAQKGYLYTSADFAFLEFANSYLFSNSNLTVDSANLIIGNVTSYCNSLFPPLMTTSNYEYVVGGEIRQTWALQTINTSRSLLSGAETTDEVADSISTAGNAYAWCFAADKMYSIASKSNTNFVQLQTGVLQSIYSNVTKAQLYPGLYARAALTDYKAGLYGAALYNSRYAVAFGNNTFGTYSSSTLANLTLSNVMNSSNGGIWPFEFSAQALFYLNQANQQGSLSSLGNLQNAYSISTLASNLNSANQFLSSSFVPFVTASNSTNIFQNSTVIDNLQTQINQIYDLLFIVLALVFVIFVLLIMLLIRKEAPKKVVAKKIVRSVIRSRRGQMR